MPLILYVIFNVDFDIWRIYRKYTNHKQTVQCIFHNVNTHLCYRNPDTNGMASGGTSPYGRKMNKAFFLTYCKSNLVQTKYTYDEKLLTQILTTLLRKLSCQLISNLMIIKCCILFDVYQTFREVKGKKKKNSLNMFKEIYAWKSSSSVSWNKLCSEFFFNYQRIHC